MRKWISHRLSLSEYVRIFRSIHGFMPSSHRIPMKSDHMDPYPIAVVYNKHTHLVQYQRGSR